ncbi:aminoacyl-tRNA deacylase [Maribellus mangrovi]|uniref:aminoacyl-tRNA deacylase n=1 Tax=Maribellus mangrovi TaxID=3133146 RepID=UPI0030ED53C0
MPAKKLKAVLDEYNVKYITIKHSSAYTAQEVASKAHISGKEVAKTIIIKIEGKFAMAVLPASYQIDFKQLEQAFGTVKISLATEEEFKFMFPDCELGAMPPFGNLYDLEVYVAQTLAEDEMIAFNAGTHTEMIQMRYEDFARLVHPQVLKFSWKTVSMPGDPSERWEMDY